ncbi:spermidine synthase [Georgenia halophila]|uniref:Spermidine synthase n=1 Tax=Georgenia halophila TaxID=620889 RepID=A0ABP8LCQ1_9MICO
MTEVLERIDGVCGELVLRRSGADFEVIANGMFLMDTRNGESERLLVTAAADAVAGTAAVLIGGLGVGYSLRAALDRPDVGDVVVVEREPAIIEWSRTGPLTRVHGDALADPRARVVCADVRGWLQRTDERFDVLCLDVDNGPRWTLTDDNQKLYRADGLDLLLSRLRPGGVLAVWGAEADEAFTGALEARVRTVTVLDVPVARGGPDVIWLAQV